MARFERIAKTWVPLTNIEEYAWPFDTDHFGEDVEEYVKQLKHFVYKVDEQGMGVWSHGLMEGTLRVVPGSTGGHFDNFNGQMLVSDEENKVGTEGWTAQVKMFLIPGEKGEVCKIIWNWNNGPCKGKAVVTYWEDTRACHDRKGHKSNACSMM